MASPADAAEITEGENQHMIENNGVVVEADDHVHVSSSSDPKEMRAVILAGFGGINKLRVTKKTMPEPGQGEVKIRVKAW